MSEAISLAEAASHRDPEVGLAAVAALRQMLEQLEALQVKAAREGEVSDVAPPIPVTTA